MFLQLVVAIAFEAEEVDLVVIVSAVQILLHGELHHQIGLLPWMFQRELYRLQVVQRQRLRRQSHQVQQRLFPQVLLEAFRQVHELVFPVHPFNILRSFTTPVRMLHYPII
jgi:hypothetical protein